MEANSQPWLSSVGVLKTRTSSRCDLAVWELTFQVDHPGRDRGRLIADRTAPHDITRHDVLTDTDVAFEELANGGLEILGEEIRGAGDVLQTVVLLVSVEQNEKRSDMDSFDLAQRIT